MKRFYVEIFWITCAGNGLKSIFIYRARNGEHAKKLTLKAFKKGHQRMYGEEIKKDQIRRMNVGEIKSGFFLERKWNNPR